MDLKPEIYSNLPTIEQFRRGIGIFVSSLAKASVGHTSEMCLGVCAYIDPIARKSENLPPWYALLPVGTYAQTISSRQEMILANGQCIVPAELDKFNDGGVVYTNIAHNYELVRVDYFSAPSPKMADDVRIENSDIIGHYIVNGATRIIPGFYIENLEDIYPIGVKIYTNPREINVAGYDFLNLIEGDKIKDSIKAFAYNMENMRRDIKGEHIKTVALTSAKIDFNATDAYHKTKHRIHYWNTHN